MRSTLLYPKLLSQVLNYVDDSTSQYFFKNHFAQQRALKFSTGLVHIR